MSNNHSSRFFLISFLPALAYWYLEENFSLETALVGGVILAILEIIIEKIFAKHVHTISKLNFFLIVILGGVSYFAREGVWFKLQPFFTGLCMSSYLLYKYKKGESLMLEFMHEMNRPIPFDPELMKTVELHLALFLFLYGCFMAVLAFWGTTSQWAFFKTAGFYIVSFGFMMIEFFFLKHKMKGKK